MSLQIRRVADLQVGDLGFTSILGRVGAGVLAGQTGIDLAALLRGQPGTTSGWITHAYMVVGRPPSPRPGGVARIVEAMPSGARGMTISDDVRVGRGYAYVRLPLNAEERHRAAVAAVQMVGTPYGFAQYAAIAALTLAGGKTASTTGPLARYVNRRDPATGLPRQVICSQLVDEALRIAGVHLFADGRPAQYVTPGSLFWRAAQLGDVCVC